MPEENTYKAVSAVLITEAELATLRDAARYNIERSVRETELIYKVQALEEQLKETRQATYDRLQRADAANSVLRDEWFEAEKRAEAAEAHIAKLTADPDALPSTPVWERKIRAVLGAKPPTKGTAGAMSFPYGVEPLKEEATGASI